MRIRSAACRRCNNISSSRSFGRSNQSDCYYPKNPRSNAASLLLILFHVASLLLILQTTLLLPLIRLQASLFHRRRRSLNKEKHQHKDLLVSKMSTSSTVDRVVYLDCDVVLQQSDWSDLPKDLLELIFLRLRYAADLIRIRAVCNKWRSVVNTLRHKPLCPLLLLNTDNSSDVYNLFDFSNSKIHRTQIYPTNQASCPKNLFKNGCFTNSCNGWLVRMDYSVLSWPIHLINPFTRVEIQLPPAVTFEERDADIIDSMNRRFLRKAVLSSAPLDPKCIVVAIYCTHDIHNKDLELKLAFCSLRDATWKKIKSDQAKDFFVDIIYFMDRFYAIGSSNELFHCDINSNDEPKAVRISPPEPEPEPELLLELMRLRGQELLGAPEMDWHWTQVGPHGRRSRSYLVDWCGDLLMVVRYSVFNKIFITKTTKFKVFKFDFGSGRWEEVDRLGCGAGGGSIFISYSAMALLSIKEDIPQFESNCIYFTDDNDSKPWHYLRDAGMFCLSTKARKPCRVIWPPPLLWILPDLCTSVDSV
ncbi:hypothetical protein LguiB_032219 [Lonicera macranthoides]